MRLDHYVAEALTISRKDAKKWIRWGQVTVGGLAALQPALHVDGEVRFKGEVIYAEKPELLMMYKPEGVVSATEDEVFDTVIDLVPFALRGKKLAPIGRLDKDTTGLLLLTANGSLNHLLAHPKHEVEKVYLADFEGELLDDAVRLCKEGLPLRDGSVCKPASLEILSENRLRLRIREGRYHQVKRMVAALGGRVLRLHREGFGPLSLGTLLPGETRALSHEEIELLKASLT